MNNPRELEIAVISDIHLGTHSCKAKELLAYLKSIKPKKLILNGNIIDSWSFSRSYFPKSHLRIIRQIGMNEIIIYKSLKERIKHSPDKLTKFEEKVFLSARKKNCQTVICGHIHTPAIKQIKRSGFQLDYINCGDWVEHCSAAEYHNNSWTL